MSMLAALTAAAAMKVESASKNRKDFIDRSGRRPAKNNGTFSKTMFGLFATPVRHAVETSLSRIRASHSRRVTALTFCSRRARRR
ncbi:MAG TPA: hypothetical protein VF883_13500 [Thermoanaerobaculia bacterium]